MSKSSLTFAPEAGTQRLRNVINKGLTVDDIMNGSKQAFEGGWNKVKFYFMLGLPTETEEDMRGIPELANDVAALYYDTVPKEKRAGKCQITISTSFSCQSLLHHSSGRECMSLLSIWAEPK